MIKISVIVLSYNHENYIRETIESIINQDYCNLIEIIIVDDCSTDYSREIIKKYIGKEYKNRNFKFIFKNNNLGVNDSIEQALGITSGQYVQIVASDDVLCLDKLSTQLYELEKSGYDCVYSRGFFYYDSGERLEFHLERFKKEYYNNNALKLASTQDWGLPLAQSALFKKTVLNDMAYCRRTYKSDDWAMLIILIRDYKLKYIDVPLFLYRQHPNNTYKKYNYTFPMRVEIITNLVQENWKSIVIFFICIIGVLPI
jgi:alpha-1,3-rhamnosyltransferase